MKRHYIYRIEDVTTKEFYWGVRSCDCAPNDDTYLGSPYVWKPNKTNLVKTNIIEYNTREEANEAEHIVIRYYQDKIKFPLNRNYHDNSNWCKLGMKCGPLTQEHKDRIRAKLKGTKHIPGKKRRFKKRRPRTAQEKLNISLGMEGCIRPRCSEETKLKIGAANKLRHAERKANSASGSN